jgi:hypothetical protein
MTDSSPAPPVRRRVRTSVSRMIGRWPDNVCFEDANVPVEGLGAEREVAGVWPQASLATIGRIADRR